MNVFCPCFLPTEVPASEFFQNVMMFGSLNNYCYQVVLQNDISVLVLVFFYSKISDLKKYVEMNI